MADTYWPHKMTKGLFAGRTFQTQGDYTRALRDLQNRANGRNGHGKVDASTVLEIVDSYDLLVEAGTGRSRAAEIIATLSRV